MQQLAPSREDSPYRLLSLWDIMKRFSPRSLATLGELSEIASRLLDIETVQSSIPPPTIGTLAAYSENQNRLLALASMPEKAKGIETSKLAQTLMLLLESSAREFGLRQSSRLLAAAKDNPPRTTRELAIYYNGFVQELDDNLYLWIPSDRRQYWESDAIVSEAVKKKFRRSNVVAELRSAGSAYACALDTACVFHAMRAAETGVRVIAKQIGIPAVTNDDEWKSLVERIISKAKHLDNVRRHPKKKSDSQFFSEVGTQLWLFKDAWRIPAAHSKETYSQRKAFEVLEATCRFFETVAKRYGERDVGDFPPPPS